MSEYEAGCGCGYPPAVEEQIERMQKEQRLCYLVREMIEQRKWIASCEANGVSYADGERGARIRQADTDELKRLEAEYTELREAGFSPKLHAPLPPR